MKEANGVKGEARPRRIEVLDRRQSRALRLIFTPAGRIDTVSFHCIETGGIYVKT